MEEGQCYSKCTDVIFPEMEKLMRQLGCLESPFFLNTEVAAVRKGGHMTYRGHRSIPETSELLGYRLILTSKDMMLRGLMRCELRPINRKSWEIEKSR